MKRIRQLVTCFCLATILSAAASSPAVSGEATPEAAPAGTLKLHPVKLDLSRLRNMAGWSAPTTASPGAPVPLMAQQTQATQGGGGWSSYSTAKKTWIIVGSVVGAGAIVLALSNHGGSGGGGGY